MEFSTEVSTALACRLRHLYGDQADAVLPLLLELMSTAAASMRQTAAGWDQRDCVLIAYGDQLRSDDRSPLQTLREFLLARRLDEVLSTVHLLPFCPYTSDDGFSVLDYQQVDPSLGTWDDVAALGRHFDLMFDLVLNHISRGSAWFEGYLAGRAPYDRFFIEVDPTADVSQVTRPRSHPLLTPLNTSRGPRHLWTTFSDDQIDLNYAEPRVLLRMVEILLDYAARGARIVRLDAIAYLWKRLGTTCIHLPETHTVVKLFRDVVRAVAPHVLLLTETNVPHAENISYFGAADEAQMVYQFSLPPLLLDAFVSGDASTLTAWLADLAAPPAGATFFNFTASHDGVGLRPLEGLAPPERILALVREMETRDGLVSTRRQADGRDSPYELNISYVDALRPNDHNVAMHARRFLSSQAVMLALQGIPGVYFHSLVGSGNDLAGVAASGMPRRINRRKYRRRELDDLLDREGSLSQRIFAGYQHLLRCRRDQTAFHPNASQSVVSLGERGVLALLREGGGQQILTLVNVSGDDVSIDLARGPAVDWRRDLISGAEVDPRGLVRLPACQAMWLSS